MDHILQVRLYLFLKWSYSPSLYEFWKIKVYLSIVYFHFCHLQPISTLKIFKIGLIPFYLMFWITFIKYHRFFRTDSNAIQMISFLKLLFFMLATNCSFHHQLLHKICFIHSLTIRVNIREIDWNTISKIPN